jgi:N-acetylglutamate synthase-like GNAT family acetyltransferase
MIIQYKQEYKEQVQKFINECMYKFIGRPYKNRPDIDNIEDYYLKNNGNFLIALKENSIIGTIAIENRGKVGILKRFYVEEQYQHMGVGQSLYTELEQFICNNTEIKTIYLACGRILQSGHKFYTKNGYIQTPELEIEMHVAEDDDFFKKEL